MHKDLAQDLEFKVLQCSYSLVK